MRTLLVALAGLIVGAIVIAGIGVAQGGNAYWSVVIAGLIAGVLMRAIAAGRESIYLKGGLAALATVLAAVSGPLVATEWFRSQTVSAKPDLVAVVDQEESQEGAENSEALVDVEAPEELAISGVGSASNLDLTQPGPGSFDPAEITCLVVGCLLAYLVGKGSSHPTTATTETEIANNPDEAERAPVEEV